MRLYEIEILFFIVVAFILGLLFLFKTKKTTIANFILVAYLTLFSHHLFQHIFSWTRLLYSRNYFDIRLGGKASLVFTGILFYIYIKYVVTKEVKVKDLIHFLLYPLFAMVYLFRPIESLLIQKVYILAIVLQLFFYGLLSFQLYKKNSESITATKKLWLKLFFIFFFIFWFIFSCYFFISYVPNVAFKSNYFFILTTLLFVSLIFSFSRVLSKGMDGLSIVKVNSETKYKTGLSKNYSIELKEDLKKMMLEKEPFLKNDLRLEDLADILNLSRHEMSQVINEHFKVSFFDFINKYRIEKAKKLLTHNSEELNISEIAYSVGFNNRASFYKAFRKHTNTTPSNYSTINKF